MNGRPARVVSVAARSAFGAVVIARLVRTARRRPPLEAHADDAGTRAASTSPPSIGLPSISVVVPARDEAARLGPLLEALAVAPHVDEVIVVDDQSTDGTAELAAAAGARVIEGAPLPPGWAGKAWALQQGIDAAATDWVVTLDADTRPEPALPGVLVARAVADHLDLVTVGGRFECPTAGVQWLHPAMLTTLVYRFGAPGAVAATAPDRQLANGQCMAMRRERFLAEGGMAVVAGEVVEDVALARSLARRGWAVAMLDGSDLLTTRMYEDLGDAWRGWGRSLALPGVEPTWRQWFELVLLLVTQVLPLPRLLLRRGDLVDLVLLLVRLGTLGGTAKAYRRPGVAYWASPLADGVAVAAVAGGIVRRRQSWRGRRYG